MRLGEGTLENGDAKDIRDKHNVSMATSKWFSLPAPSHWPLKQIGRNRLKYTLPKKGAEGGGGIGWGRN